MMNRNRSDFLIDNLPTAVHSIGRIHPVRAEYGLIVRILGKLERMVAIGAATLVTSGLRLLALWICHDLTW